MYGMMKGGTKEIGFLINCMGEEYIIGHQAESMKENIKMITNMVLDAILGRMGENILVNGKIIKEMDKAN